MSPLRCSSVTMRPHIILVVLLQAALVESLLEVHGFLGETAVLPSGANTADTLTTIQWSIHSNITLIATLRNGRQNTERLSWYKGRLSLNTATGDLTIQNITEKDATEYTVNLMIGQTQSTKKVKLTVKQRLQKPTIDIFQKNDSCVVALHCSALEKDVVFSWKVDPAKVSTIKSISGMNSSVLLVSLNTAQNPVEFTCTANRNQEYTSRTITYGCNATETDSGAVRVCPPSPPQPRSRACLLFVGGFFVGFFLAVLLCASGGESRSSAS